MAKPCGYEKSVPPRSEDEQGLNEDEVLRRLMQMPPDPKRSKEKREGKKPAK